MRLQSVQEAKEDESRQRVGCYPKCSKANTAKGHRCNKLEELKITRWKKLSNKLLRSAVIAINSRT
jgi:hypothetical protein